MKNKRFLIVLFIIAIATLGLTALKNDDKNFNISKNLNIFATLFRDINLFYVDEIDADKTITTGINAMLKSLDPYTVYYPESETEELSLMTTGEYAGIGSVINKKGDHVIIREPYKGSPADKAGLLPGDIILAIDGQSTEGKDVSQVSDMLKGQPGNEITIKVSRKYENKPLEKKAIREKIQIPSVPYYGMANDSTGYIYLSSFTDKSAADVRSAIIGLSNRGARSLILDLRGNAGGLLDQAIEIVNFFIPRNSKVVSTKGKVKQWDKEYLTGRNPIVPDIPLAVLIDRGSASAAEIVSGSLQDLDRAVLIGERSFGKGLVQTVRDLTYNTKLKVTTAKYYIPSGRCIQAIDYSHSQEGSVRTVPDSLISEFTTRAGRKVYDGGGIMPDIRTEPEYISRFAATLYAMGFIEDFGDEYTRRNPGQAIDIRTFSISDDDYADFAEFMKEKKVPYESDTRRALKALKKAADEDLFDDLKARFEKVEAELKDDTQTNLETYREQVIGTINNDIVMRHAYQAGVIEHSLPGDAEVARAIGVLENPEEYARITSEQDTARK